MTDTPDSDQRPDDEPDVPTKKETAATAQSVASTDKDTSDDQPQDEGTPETAATDNPWRVDPAS